jgi:signal transduction protein with GAF and PtsI domain
MSKEKLNFGFDDQLKTLLGKIRRVMKAGGVTIWLSNRNTGFLEEVITDLGIDSKFNYKTSFQLNEEIVGVVASERKTIQIEDLTQEPRFSRRTIR